MKINKEDIKTNGTSYQGKIDITYQELVGIFGEPGGGSADGKIDAEWDIQFDDGTVATIYNWKNGKSYLGDYGRAVSDITDWHIGGFSKDAVTKVKEAINESQEN